MKEIDKIRGRYIKRPISVECEQFSRDEYIETGYLPEGVSMKRDNPIAEGWTDKQIRNVEEFFTTTANGDVPIKDTNWVLKGDDEYYPCPNGVFMDTYLPEDEYKSDPKNKPHESVSLKTLGQLDMIQNCIGGIREELANAYPYPTEYRLKQKYTP